MKDLTYSIFLPHDNLLILSDTLLIPLTSTLKKYNNTLNVNYFLSTHKGENVTLKLYFEDNKGSEKLDKICKRLIGKFLEQHTDQTGINDKLPVNQLFLNFPAYTLYCWNSSHEQEHDPFDDRRVGHITDVQDKLIKTMLTECCLNYIVHAGERIDLLSFYIELLYYFNTKIPTGTQIKIRSISGQIINYITASLNYETQKINDFKSNIYNAYNRNTFELDQYLSERKKLEELKSKFSFYLKYDSWWETLEAIFEINDRFPASEKEIFYTDLIININQKLSLDVKYLLKAGFLINLASQKNRIP